MLKIIASIILSFFIVAGVASLSHACDAGDYKITIARYGEYVPSSDTRASLSILKSDSREVLSEDIFHAYQGGEMHVEHNINIYPDGIRAPQSTSNKFEMSFLPAYRMNGLCRLVFKFNAMDRVVSDVSADGEIRTPEYVGGYNSVDVPDLQPIERQIIFRFHYIADAYLYFIIERM